MYTITHELIYKEARSLSRQRMDGDKPVGGNWNYDSETSTTITLTFL